MTDDKDFRDADPDPNIPRVDEDELPHLEDGQFPPNANSPKRRESKHVRILSVGNARTKHTVFPATRQQANRLASDQSANRPRD